VKKMKVWIVHDSKHGNGKRIAEIFGKTFENDEVKISHIKHIKPKEVVKDSPDVLVVGCAVRIFRISGSRKWLNKLQQVLKKSSHKIDFGICFVTHARDLDKISKHTDKFYELLKEGNGITKIYPEYLLCQVEDIEGPFKPGVIENAVKFSNTFQKWINPDEVLG
jgi:flavodoxin